jgi:H+/Cl- antiporter ClcA
LEAASALGVGLVFDPFDPQQTWKERPLWKKVWLFVHLAVVAGLFGLGVGIGDK